jgi:hypothetical protein
MAQRKQPPPATAAEAEAFTTVYARLTDLITALRQARGRLRHPQLLALVDAEIDRQLEADGALRQALLDATGKPLVDPY